MPGEASAATEPVGRPKLCLRCHSVSAQVAIRRQKSVWFWLFFGGGSSSALHQVSRCPSCWTGESPSPVPDLFLVETSSRHPEVIFILGTWAVQVACKIHPHRCAQIVWTSPCEPLSQDTCSPRKLCSDSSHSGHKPVGLIYG